MTRITTLLLAVALTGCTSSLAASQSTETTMTVAPAATGPVGITTRPADGTYRVMVVGDSVGSSIGEVLTARGGQVGVIPFDRSSSSCNYDRERTSSGSGFVEDPNCVRIVNAWDTDVDTFQPTLVLFIYGSWSNWYWQGQVRTQCDPLMAGHVTDLYAAALDDLGSTGAPVYFVAPPYWRAAGYDSSLDAAYDCTRSVMRAFVAAHSTRAGFIDLQAMVCDGADCGAMAGGLPVRADGLHFSEPGASTVTMALLAQAITPLSIGWPKVEPITH